jgi:hypothetical protein
MVWQQIHERIYYPDGSLRDIYVLGTNEGDWRNWVDFVNATHSVRWKNANDETVTQIDFNQVLDRWRGYSQEVSHAAIMVGRVVMNVHLFCESEIEHDLSPKEITSEEDHNNIVAYLQSLSQHLGKKVILTPENMPDYPLLVVEKDKVVIVPCEQ